MLELLLWLVLLPGELPAADSLPQPTLQWSVSGRHARATHPMGVALTQSGAEPQTMRAMDPETGALGWSLREEAAAIREVQVTPAGWLILSDNAVREVRARDGAELWRLLGGADSVGMALHSVAFCKQGVLRAYAPPSPEQLWEEACVSVDGNGSELVADTLQGLTRLDPASGAILWQLPGLRGTPLVRSDRVLVSSGDELISLDLEMGELQWSRIFTGTLQELPGGELLALSPGQLMRLDPSTGEPLWTAELPAGTGSATLSDGDDQYALLLLEPEQLGAPPLAARVSLDSGEGSLIPLLTRPQTATLLSDGDLLVSSPQGVGRLDLDQPTGAWESLSATQQLALVRAWPLGHPAELSARLIGLLDADPSPWPELLAGLPKASERELLMLLDAIDALRPEGALPPLVERAAAEPPGPLRRRLTDTLFAYGDQALLEAMSAALQVPSQRVLAREVLLSQATPESRALLADALAAQTAAPYAWDCAGEFFCESGPDADSDGWPDTFEQTIGTDPASADSDGDGLPDAQDPCPSLAEHAAPDARHQAALEALLFGQQPVPLLITEPVCFAGVPGPQVRSGQGLVAVGFGFPGPAEDPQEGATTTVEVNFVTGPRAASGYEVGLLFEGGRWVPTRVRQAWKS